MSKSEANASKPTSKLNQSKLSQLSISESEVLRPTHVEVDLQRIEDNFLSIRKAVPNATVMAILKANAYGHGLVEVAQHLEKTGCDYLGVAFLEEGILLREAGVQSKILVLGGIFDNQIPLFLKYDLTLTASSVDKLGQINQIAREQKKVAKVHLKIDTGMERIGTHYYSAESLIRSSLSSESCDVEGIYSHFSDSDNLATSQIQLDRFKEVLSIYQKHGVDQPRFVHISNSGAILSMPDAHFNMVRAGILLYGVYPSTKSKKSVSVVPALSWKTKVVYFKVVKPGHPVSYGSLWESSEETRIVTVPIGYGDGYFRSMMGNAQVAINGNCYPVVGAICMDQMMVNIGWDSAYNGDDVVLIGKSENCEIRVEDLAEWAGTIPYEVLTNINTRVSRVYTNSKK